MRREESRRDPTRREPPLVILLVEDLVLPHGGDVQLLFDDREGAVVLTLSEVEPQVVEVGFLVHQPALPNSGVTSGVIAACTTS